MTHVWTDYCNIGRRELGWQVTRCRKSAKGSFQPMQDGELKFRKRSDLSERTSDGETLILDRINGQIHHLNSTASYVWTLCDGSSINAIAENLAQAFQIDSAIAEKDVIVLLNEMKRMNLLETCDNLI